MFTKPTTQQVAFVDQPIVDYSCVVLRWLLDMTEPVALIYTKGWIYHLR